MLFRHKRTRAGDFKDRKGNLCHERDQHSPRSIWLPRMRQRYAQAWKAGDEDTGHRPSGSPVKIQDIDLLGHLATGIRNTSSSRSNSLQ